MLIYLRTTKDDRDHGNVIHKQIHRNWLGSLKIPFSTLYFNYRVIKLKKFVINVSHIQLKETYNFRLMELSN